MVAFITKMVARLGVIQIALAGCSIEEHKPADFGAQRKTSQQVYGATAMTTSDRSLKFLQQTEGIDRAGQNCQVISGQEIVYHDFRLTRGGFEVMLAEPLKNCSGQQIFFPVEASTTQYLGSHAAPDLMMMVGDQLNPEFSSHHDTVFHYSAGTQPAAAFDNTYESMVMRSDVQVPSLDYDTAYQRLVFPLFSYPLEDFTTGGREFGALRDNGHRLHAANDLVEHPGNPVYAVADGVIIGFYDFYYGTQAVVVDHGSFVVRYGEISRLWDGLSVGDYVKVGQKIAVVGHLYMLHFEKYSGSHQGPLTNRHNQPYQRRADLVKPTEFLQALIDTQSFPEVW